MGGANRQAIGSTRTPRRPQRRLFLSALAALTATAFLPGSAAAGPTPRQSEPAPAAGDSVLRTDGSPLVPIRPKVVFDSRAAGGRVRPGVEVEIPVAGRGGVPGAGAGSVVVKVLTEDAVTAGQVRLYATGADAPELPDLYVPRAGDAVGHATAKLGRRGSLTLLSTARTHVTVIVKGWYLEGDPIVPVADGPILDTTTGDRVTPRDPVRARVTGRGSVPERGVAAVLLKVNAVDARRSGQVQVVPAGDAAPPGADLRFAPGRPAVAFTTVATGRAGLVRVLTSAPVHLRLEVVAYFSRTAGTRPVAGQVLTTGPSDTSHVAPGEPLTLDVADERARAAFVRMAVLHPDAPGRVSIAPEGASPTSSDLVHGRRPASASLMVRLPDTGRVVVRSTTPVDVMVDLVAWTRRGTQRRSSVTVPSTTEILGPGDVTGRLPRPGETDAVDLLLTPSADRPPVDGHVVVSDTGPSSFGFVGRVLDSTATPDGGAELLVKSTPMAKAFGEFDLHFRGPAPLAAEGSGPAGGSFLKNLVIPCGGDADMKVDIQVKDAIARIDRFDAVVVDVGGPRLHLEGSVGFVADFDVAGELRLRCEVPRLPGLEFTVWAGPIPIVIAVKPAIELSGNIANFTAGLDAGLRVDLGVHYEGGDWSRSSASVSPTWDLTFGDVEGPEADLKLVAGPEVSVTVAGRAGVAALAGGELATTFAADGAIWKCRPRISAFLQVNAVIDLLVSKISAEIFRHTFASQQLPSVNCGRTPPPTARPGNLPRGFTGVPYAHHLRSIAGVPPLTWTATGLPPGLSIAGDEIVGTPTATGDYDVSFKVTDDVGRFSRATEPLEVVAPPGMMDEVRGNIARKADGTSWYVDRHGGRHHIPDGDTYNCLVDDGKSVVVVSQTQISKFPLYDDAVCLDTDPGDILRHESGASYLQVSGGRRRPIADAESYDCLALNGHAVVTPVPWYVILDLARGPNLGSQCLTPLEARGKVVRFDNNTTWLIDRRGDRHWIPDVPTYNCLADRHGDAGQLLPAYLLSKFGTERANASCS